MNNLCQRFSFRISSHLPRYMRAFSLHDVLVTMTIVSTATIVAVPSFQKFMSSQRMSGAANSLVTAIHLTRSVAIFRGERAVLCPSADGLACSDNGIGDTVWENGYLLFIDRDGNHDFNADDMVVQTFNHTTGLSIRSSAYRDHVTYRPNGLASGSNLTFTICDKHGRGTPRAVIVSSSGRPRVSARNASGGAIRCTEAN